MWEHQKQIVRGLLRFQTTAKDKILEAACAWQIFVCHALGFGVSQSTTEATIYAKQAMDQGHPIALLLTPYLLDYLEGDYLEGSSPAESYPELIAAQFRLPFAAQIPQILYLKRLEKPPAIEMLKFRSIQELSPEKMPSRQVSFYDIDFEASRLVENTQFSSWEAVRHHISTLQLFEPSSGLSSIARLQEIYFSSYITLPEFGNRAMTFLEASVMHRDPSLIEILHKGGLDLNDARATVATDSLLIQACRLGDADMVICLLENEADPNQQGPDGCTLFHWLFALSPSGINRVSQALLRYQGYLMLDIQSTEIHYLHKQWPLELLGSPLAFAVSSGNKAAVQALLQLGANPFAPAYNANQFLQSDPRSEWTPLHLATKYHLPGISSILIHYKVPGSLTGPPLAWALGFSSPLERLALHGRQCGDALMSMIQLLSQYQDLKETNSKGFTALMQAIDLQDHVVVAALLESDLSLATASLVNPKDEGEFNSPMHFAANMASQSDESGFIRIMKLLFICNPDLLLQRDHRGRTPLHYAASGPSIHATEWLLSEQPGLLDIEDDAGKTPLHYCNSKANCVLLLKHHANADHADKTGISPVHRFCLHASVELLKELLRFRPLLSLINNPYGGPLHCAVTRGSSDITFILLNAGADPNLRNQRGDTALIVASQVGNLHLAQILLKHKVDVNIQNCAGQSALHAAVRFEDPVTGGSNASLVQWLLDSGSDHMLVDLSGRAPLSYAVQSGNVALVTMLLEHGARPDLEGEESLIRENIVGRDETVRSVHQDLKVSKHGRRTSLSYAAEIGNEAVVILLLKNGANPSILDFTGDSPLSFAIENGHDTIVRLLLQEDAIPKLYDAGGLSTLEIAAALGDEDSVRTLLATGARPAAKRVVFANISRRRSVDSEGLCSLEKFVHELEGRADVALFDPDLLSLKLVLSTRKGDERMCWLLLLMGADPNLRDWLISTPLQYAVMEHFPRLV